AQSEGGGVSPEPPGPGGGMVCRQSEPDCRGDPKAREGRQGRRRAARQDRLAAHAMSTLDEIAVGTPPAQGPTLDLHEIQATVLRPRPAPYFGAHVLLRVDDARAGRELIRRLTPHIDSAASWWNSARPWLSVAISYAGLQALGVPLDSLQSFPEAFRVGMAARARQLRDDGVTAPRHWRLPFC